MYKEQKLSLKENRDLVNELNRCNLNKLISSLKVGNCCFEIVSTRSAHQHANCQQHKQNETNENWQV